MNKLSTQTKTTTVEAKRPKMASKDRRMFEEEIIKCFRGRMGNICSKSGAYVWKG